MKSWIMLVSTLVGMTVAGASSAAPFELQSQAWRTDAQIQPAQVLNGFGCSGRNVSPDLKWTNPPVGTKSFAVFLFDPDAPTGSGWWHWVAYDIPANVNELTAGSSRKNESRLGDSALQGRNDFGFVGYGGPCPPEGRAHRYQLTVYALKVDTLGVPADASPALISFMARANALASQTLIAPYSR